MHRLVPLAAGIGIALAVAGCQTHNAPHESGAVRPVATVPAAPGQVTTSPATPASTTNSPSAVAPPPAAPTTTGGAGTAPKSTPKAAPSAIPLAEACNQEVLRLSVQGLAPDMTTGVQRVRVYFCVKGFARLSAVPYLDAEGRQPGGDQFYLQFTAGQWHVLERGSGIDCGDGEPKLAEACAAFDSVA
jgi:hypothetical protein